MLWLTAPHPHQAQVSEHLFLGWWHYPGRWCSPAGGSVSLGIGFEAYWLILHPVCSFCFMLAFEDVSFQLPAPIAGPTAACCHASSPWWMRIPLQPRTQINHFFRKLLLVMVFYLSNRKVTNTSVTSPKNWKEMHPDNLYTLHATFIRIVLEPCSKPRDKRWKPMGLACPQNTSPPWEKKHYSHSGWNTQAILLYIVGLKEKTFSYENIYGGLYSGTRGICFSIYCVSSCF